MTQASPAIAAALTRWHQCVADKNISALREILAEDIRFHSPFLWKPKEGRDAALTILSNVVQVFEDFKYHREMTDGTTWTLEFSARVGELVLKGVDIIRFDEDGRIADFEVMIRPANALQALGAEMGRRLSLNS
jgi:hypothetical protein